MLQISLYKRDDALTSHLQRKVFGYACQEQQMEGEYVLVFPETIIQDVIITLRILWDYANLKRISSIKE